MKMTDKEKHELRMFCASLLEEHGFQFSAHDPVLPVMYIIHKEMELCNKVNDKFRQEIQRAAAKINPKVFHFDRAGEAFQFQLGIALKWVIYAGLTMIAITIGVWYWSLSNEIDRARTIIHVHDNLSRMATQAKKNKEGSYFIDLSQARGDSVQHFREYVRIDKKTVRVFLGRD
jgi:hypothetical protein